IDPGRASAATTERRAGMRLGAGFLRLARLAALGWCFLGAAQVQALDARDLGVVINTADPLSVAIGDYYAQARHIPAANVARVHFGYHRAVLLAAEFAAVKRRVDAQLPG